MRFAVDDEVPLVSVCLLTYKHERWIRQAIDSVLMQQTDFACEFIIAEDCSPDQTRAIVLSYAERYPIKLLLQETNKGAARNWKDLMAAPRGKYIAFFEGDDAWIDPLKLQKQAAILEGNENIAFCYSNAAVFDTNNPGSNVYFSENAKPATIINRYEAVQTFRAPTCTFFFRNRLNAIPDWALQVRGGDHLMMALLCKYGDAYYIDECLGLYNYDYTGLSRVVAHEHFLVDDFLPWFNLYKHYDEDPKIWEAIIQKGYVDINKLFHKGWRSQARGLFWKWPFRKIMTVSKLRLPILKLGLKLHFPFFLQVKRAVKN